MIHKNVTHVTDRRNSPKLYLTTFNLGVITFITWQHCVRSLC